MNQLPIINSYEGCGVCCMEQLSPPGYVMLLSSPELIDEVELFAADVERLMNLPDEAMNELREYMQRLLSSASSDGEPCIWLDLQSMRCRFH